MIYILFGLLIALAWAIWFILQWHIAIPLIATGVLGLIMLVLFVFHIKFSHLSVGHQFKISAMARIHMRSVLHSN